MTTLIITLIKLIRTIIRDARQLSANEQARKYQL